MNKIIQVPIIDLKPDPNQPRTDWDEHGEHIDRLARSYASQGIIVPIEADENNMIVLGECRWRAAKKVGLKEVPVRRIKSLTPQKRLERQLIDDTHKDLTIMEKVWAYATSVASINTKKGYTVPQVKKMWKKDPAGLLSLIVQNSWSGKKYKKSGQAELARRLGISQSQVSFYFLYFDERVTDAQRAEVESGNLTLYHLQQVMGVKRAAIRETITQSVSKARAEGTRRLPIRVDDTVKAIKRLERTEADAELIEIVAEGLIKPDAAELVAEVKSKEAQRKIAKIAKSIEDPEHRAVTVKRAASEVAFDEYTAKQIAEFQPTEEQKLSAMEKRQRDKFFWNHPDMKRIHAWNDCSNFLYFMALEKGFCPVCENPASTHLRFACHPDKNLQELASMAREKWEKLSEEWKIKRKVLDEQGAWRE